MLQLLLIEGAQTAFDLFLDIELLDPEPVTDQQGVGGFQVKQLGLQIEGVRQAMSGVDAHHQRAIVERGKFDACRGGPPAGSNFVDHSGLVTEVILLGNIAVRSQKKLLWDGVKMEFTNDKAANKLLRREYRQGWTL